MINRKIFFSQFKKLILKNRTLNQNLVNSLNQFLDFMESDTLLTSVYHRAFLLANTYHETAHTFAAIKEKGGKNYFIANYWNKLNVRKQLGNIEEKDAWNRSGAGYTQVTGLGNDIKLTKALPQKFPHLIKNFEKRTGKTFNLVEDHWQLLDPEIAYAAMSYGVYSGLFTGKKISAYVNDKKNEFKDYWQGRRTINGTDKAELIAGYCVIFESILLLSATGEEKKISEPQVTEQPSEIITQPESNSALINNTEQKGTEQTVTTTEDGKVTQKETEKNEQDVSDDVTVKDETLYNGVGFFPTIKKDLTVLFGGNLTIQGISDVLHQYQDLSLGAKIVATLATLVAVGSVFYLISRIVSFVIFTWKRHQKLKLEAEAATDVTKKNLTVVLNDKMELKRGFFG